MQAKISKTLEAIIARTAFETSKRAITHSLKDFLTLEILREEGSLAHQILTSRLKDWEIHQICLRIESEIRSVSAPDSSRQNPEEFFPLYTRELQRLFAPMHHVSTAHALLHIVSDPHTITSQVLAMYHFDAQAIATELQKMTLEADQTTPPDTNFRPTPELRFIGLREPVRDTPPAEPALLDKFGTDLTYEARRGRIDPVVGREREMERIVQILSRRKKNNPLILGEPGVGKTAIAEGLAQRIVRGDVPKNLQDKTIFSLDMGSLIAGAKYRGEFEERIKNNTLTEVLNAVPVHKGDCFFIPAGTLHAICKGIVIAEVQQNSNVTYRVYDYGRVGADGKPRALHIEKALDVTRRTPPQKHDFGSHLAQCEYFTVDAKKGAFDGVADEKSFVSLLITDGAGTLTCGGETVKVKKGESYFIPAGSGKYAVTGDCETLVTVV